MPLEYKIDVLKALKEAGYNTGKMRKDKILAESTIQKLRDKEPISWGNIEQICKLLDCQPNHIIRYVKEKPSTETVSSEE